MSEKTLAELREIIRDVFSDPTLVIGRQTSAGHVRNWDSLNHMRLIAAVEDHFGIAFSFDEARAMRDVGDLLDLVLTKTSA